MARPRSRVSSPSLTGPSKTSSASPASIRLNALLSCKLKVPVRATSLTTFIIDLNRATKVSLGTPPVFSSSRTAKALARSSSDKVSSSFSPAAFGSLPTKATYASLEMVSLEPTTSLKSSRGVTFFSARAARRRFMAFAPNSFTSAASFLVPWSLKVLTAVFALLICNSKVLALLLILAFSAFTHFSRTFSTSSQPNFSACSAATLAFSAAALTEASNSAARANMA
mmetsp:Transcript_99266/g.320001  ORF Transcript_99266/g.320001 Transcript_99266/m.320001 type:complete len:226 (+) Transcript_99266:596-1273(+)